MVFAALASGRNVCMADEDAEVYRELLLAETIAKKCAEDAGAELADALRGHGFEVIV